MQRIKLWSFPAPARSLVRTRSQNAVAKRFGTESMVVQIREEPCLSLATFSLPYLMLAKARIQDVSWFYA